MAGCIKFDLGQDIMDTLTQALLGGAVGFVVAGKHSPRKALLWGAAIAVLPDLDIFIPHDNDLDAVTMHRSWTHSWLMQTLIAPILAYGLYKKDPIFGFTSWWWLIWLALVTHSGLDALTVYGTQLFWPFMPPPVSGGSVFIIDPLYSISLLIGFIAITIKPNSLISRRYLLIGFVFSCCYLIWGLFAQNSVTQQAKLALAEQGINQQQILVTATPFNSLLWRVLVIDGDDYYEGFRSVFDQDDKFHFTRHNRHMSLQPLIHDLPAMQRLDWFTHGFYALEQQQNQIIATDLRMGIEPVYFFRYLFAEVSDNPGINAVQPQRIRSEQRAHSRLNWLWQRIWNEDVQLNKDSTGT